MQSLHLSYGKVRFGEVNSLPQDKAWQKQHVGMGEGTESFSGEAEQEPRQEPGEDLVASEASGEAA